MEISVEPQMPSRYHSWRYLENQHGEKNPCTRDLQIWRDPWGKEDRVTAPSSFHTLGASQCGCRASFLPIVSSQEPAVPHAAHPSERSLKTNLQGLPQHPQVCRPGAKIKQKLPLEVAWPGHHFSVLLLKLMLLPLALVAFGAPRRLLWPWRGKVSPCGFLGHRLSKKRYNVVVRVLLFTSPLSPCCFLAVSVVPATPPVPVRAGPPWPEQCPAGPCSWSGGGRMWGQPPCQLRPHTGRSPQASTSAGGATCLLLHKWRVACCPYSCAKAVGLCPVLPPCPRGRMSVPGDAHEVVTFSCSPHCGNSIRQHRRDILQVSKTQIVPKTTEKSGGVVGW